ncbi:MAG TPA: MFS transporter [Candidatus Sulfotelmatobacter sp.]|nr:MFS transporter [Candidatus Sulfotelmatobacter sp.]
METAPDRLESAVVSRLMWRLMPFLFLLYIVAYLDRINVSFAVLQMRDQLGLSDRVYGRAAGMFFAGYFFFQLPSNLVLEKFGVRRWISALMVAWGVISCLMIFIRGPVSFYGMRFLLGAAEAGFFPGIILYMKRWFPANARARAVAWFMTANPLAGIFGSPISGALMGISGAGLSGWQWMFLMEGLPAILLGLTVLWTLSDNPREAAWLKGEEREWLLARLAFEQQAESSVKKENIVEVLISPRIWMLSLVYFGVSTTMYGVTLWLPSVIRSLSGLSYVLTGLISALPFLLTAIAMVLVGMSSDRARERRWHTAVPAFVGAAALVAAGYGTATTVVVACLGLGMACAEGMGGPFWAMATSRMTGLSAAAGIAVINSLANLGGYFGPDIIGFFRKTSGGFRGGLLAIGATLAVSGAVALIVGRQLPGERSAGYIEAPKSASI